MWSGEPETPVKAAPKNPAERSYSQDVRRISAPFSCGWRRDVTEPLPFPSRIPARDGRRAASESSHYVIAL